MFMKLYQLVRFYLCQDLRTGQQALNMFTLCQFLLLSGCSVDLPSTLDWTEDAALNVVDRTETDVPPTVD